MQPDEPIEPRFVSNSQAIADEAWRAEVASRVSSYRARRTGKGTGDTSPALDLSPEAGAQSIATPSPAPSTPSLAAATPSPVYYSVASPAGQARPGRAAARSAEALNPAQRGAFDTNYYRRLNAESMAQGSAIVLGSTVAVSSPTPEEEAEFFQQSEAATEATSETMSERECEDALRDPLPDTADDEPARDLLLGDLAPGDLAAEDPALDLEIRPAVADASLDRYRISGPEPEPEPEVPAPAPPEQGNLIVFPRPYLQPPLLPQPSRDELADPVTSRPRILEVPEDIMPVVQGSLFPEIRLDGDEDEGASTCKHELESAFPVAPVPARLMAGITDWGIVMAAGLLFTAMACRALPDIPHAKPFWMVLGAVTLLLWAIYQHLFLLYAGRTVGMSLSGIRLSTFDGRAPHWKQRGRRARFMFISFAAVTLGFLWAFVDEDELCWHDRISHTFPTTE